MSLSGREEEGKGEGGGNSKFRNVKLLKNLMRSGEVCINVVFGTKGT